MGVMASTASVTIMIPMDTIKTRLVTQGSRAAAAAGIRPYKGIIDCAVTVFREEGVGAFYRGLPPRLISVVPMIGIQFGVYEFMRKVMIQRAVFKKRQKDLKNRLDDAENLGTVGDDVEPYQATNMPSLKGSAFGKVRQRRRKVMATAMK